MIYDPGLPDCQAPGRQGGQTHLQTPHLDPHLDPPRVASSAPYCTPGTHMTVWPGSAPTPSPSLQMTQWWWSISLVTMRRPT